MTYDDSFVARVTEFLGALWRFELMSSSARTAKKELDAEIDNHKYGDATVMDAVQRFVYEKYFGHIKDPLLTTDAFTVKIPCTRDAERILELSNNNCRISFPCNHRQNSCEDTDSGISVGFDASGVFMNSFPWNTTAETLSSLFYSSIKAQDPAYMVTTEDKNIRKRRRLAFEGFMRAVFFSAEPETWHYPDHLSYCGHQVIDALVELRRDLLRSIPEGTSQEIISAIAPVNETMVKSFLAATDMIAEKRVPTDEDAALFDEMSSWYLQYMLSTVTWPHDENDKRIWKLCSDDLRWTVLTCGFFGEHDIALTDIMVDDTSGNCHIDKFISDELLRRKHCARPPQPEYNSFRFNLPRCVALLRIAKEYCDESITPQKAAFTQHLSKELFVSMTAVYQYYVAIKRICAPELLSLLI